MAIYWRGNVLWYSFVFKGEHVQESTHQANRKVARSMEATRRSELAKAEMGIERRAPIPTLKQFCDDRVLPWAQARFENTTRKSWLWYQTQIRALLTDKRLANAKLDVISNEMASAFAAGRIADGYAISSANSSVRMLRRVLNLAVEWGVVKTAPKVKVLSGENHRERVITKEEETRYLAAAPEPLAFIAGHSSIAISSRYVHPGEAAVLDAMARLTQAPAEDGKMLQ